MKDAQNLPGLGPQLVESVARGDILICRGWFSCNVNPRVKGVYEEARAAAAR